MVSSINNFRIKTRYQGTYTQTSGSRKRSQVQKTLDETIQLRVQINEAEANLQKLKYAIAKKEVITTTLAIARISCLIVDKT
jgi:arylamine N-acetyltransferase